MLLLFGMLCTAAAYTKWTEAEKSKEKEKRFGPTRSKKYRKRERMDWSERRDGLSDLEFVKRCVGTALRVHGSMTRS